MIAAALLIVFAPVAAADTPTKAAEAECSPSVPDPRNDAIVICAQKPQGYRIDPDVLAAHRMKKQGEAVRPRNPHETFADHSCATVGPMGCRGQPTIDMFTAIAALAAMSERLSKGQEIGSMFQTTPAKGDYELYLAAKQEREEREADAAAAKVKAKAEAQATAGSAPTPH